MLDQRAVTLNLSLFASVLIASAGTSSIPSSAASSTTINTPCDLYNRANFAKSQAKRVQSAKCSSAEECLALGKQYLAKPSGAEMAQELLERAIALGPANAEAY